MKKSLIALAVLAASGASFAQVTVSGKLGFSLQKDAAVVSTQGMRMTDGDVVISASEDLGGGYKATASTAVQTRGRDTAVSAREATIAMAMPVGTFTVGSIETYPLLADAWGAAPASFTDGPDGIILDDGYVNVDMMSFAAPLGAVTLTGTYFEVNNGLSDSAGTALTVADTAGNKSKINGTTLTANFASGPLSLTGDVTWFDGNKAGGNVAELYSGLMRTRVLGTYDLGVASVGLGYESKTKSIAGQYTAAVSVPLGKLTVGLTHSARNAQSAVRNDANNFDLVAATEARSGTTLGAQYNLSKTTNVSAQYAVYNNVGTGTGAGFAKTHDNEYRIRLLKSF